jgi:hypothetical protein
MRSTRKVNKIGKRVKVIIIKIIRRMGMGVGIGWRMEWKGMEGNGKWVCEYESKGKRN